MGKYRRGYYSARTSEALEFRRLLSTYFVDASAPGEVQDGSSWEFAFNDLQAALKVGVSGDTIRVADGVYLPTSTLDRTVSFKLVKGVGLYGGYAGFGAPNPDARNTSSYETTLSGDIGTRDNNYDNSCNVVVCRNIGNTTVLDGFTITRGNANDTANDQTIHAGGLFIEQSSPTINNCVFRENTATFGGAVSMNINSSPAISNCVFTNNSATDKGGAFDCYVASQPTVINCLFTENSAMYGGAVNVYSSGTPVFTQCVFNNNTATNGGGMVVYYCQPTLTDCLFTGNTGTYGGGMYAYSTNINLYAPNLTRCTFKANTASHGGGLYNYCIEPNLTDCRFTGNIANASDASGGGVYNNFSMSKLTGCQINGNSAVYGGGMYNYSTTATPSAPILNNCSLTGNIATYGGGMYNYTSSPTINNCIFAGSVCNATDSYGGGLFNSASAAPKLTHCVISGNTFAYGAGMYNYSASPTLINCVISANASSYGGGMYNYTSVAPNLVNCTFWANSAANSGGGIYSYSSNPKLTNCIVWGNGVSISNASGSAPIVTYSDIEGGYSGAGNINSNPRFYRSRWTGPDGLWGTADDDYLCMRLSSASPCLNKGLSSANASATDLAGVARIAGAAIDMGAFEGGFSTTSTTLYVDQNATGNNSGATWANAYTTLSAAILAAKDGDVIRIADGTYFPTATTDRTIGFALRNAVSIYGGYAGVGAPDPNARNVQLYPTILSGDIGLPTNLEDNSYHVVSAGSVGSSTVLNGVSIVLGNANGPGDNDNFGGGMLVNSASPSVINCAFFANTSASFGGGLCILGASAAAFTNCIFTGNTALTYGGAVYNSSTAITTFANCDFCANSASYGKVIYNSTSNPKLTNCILWGNGADPIFNRSSNPTVSYCDIEGGYTGYAIKNVNPLFAQNPFAGADGLWGTADDEPGDLRLPFGSPCINSGQNSANSQTTDMDGNPRIAFTIIDMGAFETQPIPVTIHGTDADDFHVMKYSADIAMLQVWNTPDTSAEPIWSCPLSTLQTHSITFDPGAGNDVLLLDFSTISTFLGSLVNIENIQIVSDFNTSLVLDPSWLTINHIPIAISGVQTFQLNSPSLNSIFLNGEVSLKLKNPRLAVFSSDPQVLRNYILNGATGAGMAILPSDSSKPLALLDNSRLHKTTYAGIALPEPFSQLLIQEATPGDANLNGHVDQNDLLVIYARLNTTFIAPTWLDGDLDLSGTVDLADLAAVQAHLPSASLSVASSPKTKAPGLAKSAIQTPRRKHKIQLAKKKLSVGR